MLLKNRDLFEIHWKNLRFGSKTRYLVNFRFFTKFHFFISSIPKKLTIISPYFHESLSHSRIARPSLLRTRVFELEHRANEPLPATTTIKLNVVWCLCVRKTPFYPSVAPRHKKLLCNPMIWKTSEIWSWLRNNSEKTVKTVKNSEKNSGKKAKISKKNSKNRFILKKISTFSYLLISLQVSRKQTLPLSCWNLMNFKVSEASRASKKLHPPYCTWHLRASQHVSSLCNLTPLFG